LKNHQRLAYIFSKAYIICGAPCCGKSTLAERLSLDFGLIYFKADDHVSDYMLRCTQRDQPMMFQYSKLSWNEIWSKPVDVLVTEEFIFYQELFPYILEDLLKIEDDNAVLLEGAAFLPELLDDWPIDRKKVVFMKPTPEFQSIHNCKRSWIQPILNSCDNPDLAFHNWMKRDELFGDEVSRQALNRDLNVVVVDGSLSLEEQYMAINKQFDLK